MDKFWPYAGGLLGGYALIQVPLSTVALSGLEPVLDVVGVISMVVFSGAMVWNGVRALIKK